MRRLFRSVLLALPAAIAAAVGPASAQESSPVLDRFLALLETEVVPDGHIDFAGAEPLGADGVRLSGVELLARPAGVPLRMDELRLYAIDFESLEAGRAPNFENVEMIGVETEGGPLDPDDSPLGRLGFDAARLDIRVIYRRDGPVTEVDPLRITAAGNGTLTVEAQLLDLPDGLIAGWDTGWSGLLLGTRVDVLTVVYSDAGLIGRMLANGARMHGLSMDEHLAALDRALIAGLAPDQSAGGGALVYAALSRLLSDHAAPAPLTVRLAPEQPVPLAAIVGIVDFDAAAARFNLSIDYDG